MYKNYDLHTVGVNLNRRYGCIVLNSWLSKFVMEVAKKKGKRYTLKTVYGIVCRIRHYLEEKGAEGLNVLDNCDKR